MKVITRKYKLEKWKAVITNQMASGLAAAEYCRQEDLLISEYMGAHIPVCLVNGVPNPLLP